MLLSGESNSRGGNSGAAGGRYVKCTDNKKLGYEASNNIYGWSVCQSLHCTSFRFHYIERIVQPLR